MSNLHPFARAVVKREGGYTEYEGEIPDTLSVPSGPWETEPDEVMLEHAGYVCELKRHPTTGTWNGYVYVGENHPLFKNVDQDGACDFLNVHGGVTYKHAGKFGFDTSHAGDYTPTLAWSPEGPKAYRDLEYVKAEVCSLAQQLRNYDTAYHRKMFDLAEKLDKRADAIRKAMQRKEKK